MAVDVGFVHKDKLVGGVVGADVRDVRVARVFATLESIPSYLRKPLVRCRTHIYKLHTFFRVKPRP
jgi:hypothetical protein